jgi:hypothetical protein
MEEKEEKMMTGFKSFMVRLSGNRTFSMTFISGEQGELFFAAGFVGTLGVCDIESLVSRQG